MKKPVETVVDRTIGREISLRDGRIKAMVTGRIEQTRDTFVLTTELVDPADGTVVASTTERATTAAAILQAAASEARRLGSLFSEHRARIRGASPVQHLSTSSLEAFQLHNESVQVYWGRGQAEEAEPINRRALAADPECAAAWMFRAFLLRYMKGPGAEARERATSSAVSLACSPGMLLAPFPTSQPRSASDLTQNQRTASCTTRISPSGCSMRWWRRTRGSPRSDRPTSRPTSRRR
jgi:hypothetical protein